MQIKYFEGPEERITHLEKDRGRERQRQGQREEKRGKRQNCGLLCTKEMIFKFLVGRNLVTWNMWIRQKRHRE